jgi:hypothetical protein
MMKNISKVFFISMALFIVNLSSVLATDATLFGMEAGGNLATAGNLPSGFPTASMSFGFHVGAFVDINIANNIYFQPGVLYSTMGAKFSEDIYYYQTDNATWNFSYFQIPLNFSYRDKSGVNFNLAPYFGLNITASETDDIGGQSTVTNLKNSIPANTGSGPYAEPSYINSVDYGIAIGIGYLLSNGLGFRASYSLGLADVEKAHTLYDIYGNTVDQVPASVTNNVISVTVLYEFKK